MAQTHAGALKTAAKLAGVSLDEFNRLTESGLKKCTTCKQWVSRDSFSVDRSRVDGLKANCKPCASKIGKVRYAPVAIRKRNGPPPYPPRDGDAQQARQRVNVDVREGRRDHPNQLPCSECGHVWKKGERRHEYHHHKGYGYKFHADVIVLCSTCHKGAHRG